MSPILKNIIILAFCVIMYNCISDVNATDINITDVDKCMFKYERLCMIGKIK